MNHPASELQGAIFSALVASAELTSIIGVDRIYDDVPPGKHPPYVTFGKSIHADWSTDGEIGMEHEIELHAWSRQKGRKQIFLIQQAVIDALSNLDVPLETHHLINITHEQSQVEMHDKHRAFHGISRFRAVTDPIN